MAITIRSLHIYPVKGCAAVDVQHVPFTRDGLIGGDRSAMIVDAASGAFISQRHEPRLATLRTAWSAGFVPMLVLKLPNGWQEVEFLETSRRRPVTVWDDTFEATDLGDRAARFLSDWLGRPVRLVGLPGRSPRVIDPYWAGEDARSGFADLAPVLVTSTSSLADLNARRAEAGQAPIEMGRFRPNVVLDGLPAWEEDRIGALQSRTLSIPHSAHDGAALHLIKPCARCKVIELDPTDGAATGDEVLASLAKFRAGRNRRGTAGIFFGQNAVVRGGGGWSLRVGETLTAVPSPIS